MKYKVSKLSTVLAGMGCASLLFTAPVLAQNQPDSSGQDIYRLYNQNTGEHFYTSQPGEKSALVQAGWTYEGIGWVSPLEGEAVYRLYNPNADGGDHYYTTNKDEANSLVSLGWVMDNGGAAVFFSGGDINLYSAYNPNAKSGSHNYTTSRIEQDALMKAGWLHDQVAWKVLDEGREDTDPSLFQTLAGQNFVRNTWGAAGGDGAAMTINADGTYRATNQRLSAYPGVTTDWSEYTGRLSDPVKVDEYTWKVHVLSSYLTAPAGTVLQDGGSKIMVEPFAGFYAPMDFYVASPDKPISQYPVFIQERYNLLSEPLRANFPGSYVLYTADGMTCMLVK